jgi:arginyl-tRNA synthetase
VAFNKFYHECRIANEPDEKIRQTRIKLTEAARSVLGSAFSLICLKKTERI